MVASRKLSLKIVSKLPKKGPNASSRVVKTCIQQALSRGAGGAGGKGGGAISLPPALGRHPLGIEKTRIPPPLRLCPLPGTTKGISAQGFLLLSLQFIKQSLLSTYYVPGTVLGTGVGVVNKTTDLML